MSIPKPQSNSPQIGNTRPPTNDGRSTGTLIAIIFGILFLVAVVAIGFFALLGSMSVVAVKQIESQSAIRETTTNIKALETACKLFKLNTGTWPEKLEDLTTQPSGMDAAKWRGPYLDDALSLTDPWKQPFEYSVDKTRDQVLIHSKGEDGVFGTADDIPTSKRREQNGVEKSPATK